MGRSEAARFVPFSICIHRSNPAVSLLSDHAIDHGDLLRSTCRILLAQQELLHKKNR